MISILAFSCNPPELVGSSEKQTSRQEEPSKRRSGERPVKNKGRQPEKAGMAFRLHPRSDPWEARQEGGKALS